MAVPREPGQRFQDQAGGGRGVRRDPERAGLGAVVQVLGERVEDRAAQYAADAAREVWLAARQEYRAAV